MKSQVFAFPLTRKCLHCGADEQYYADGICTYCMPDALELEAEERGRDAETVRELNERNGSQASAVMERGE